MIKVYLYKNMCGTSNQKMREPNATTLKKENFEPVHLRVIGLRPYACVPTFINEQSFL